MPVRTSAAALAASIPLLGLGLLAPPAYADGGRCEQGTGVTVVVDPGSLGGAPEVGCAPDGAGQPGSSVVSAAGFTLSFTSGQPFVCRIDGLPSAADEDCQGTPPADAYWGLFWSDGDPASWTYATVGITGLEVPEGGSIGWRWQDGGARDLPAEAPNAQPSDQPSDEPSDEPSDQPSDEPSDQPSDEPSDQSTDHPSDQPSHQPSDQPSHQPSHQPPGGGSGAGGSGSNGTGLGATTAPTRSSAASPTGSAAAGGASSESPRAARLGATPSAPQPSQGAARTSPRRTAVAVTGDASSDGGSGTRPAAESAPAAKELEPLADAGGGHVVPLLAALALLGLATGAAVVGRRRRTGS